MALSIRTGSFLEARAPGRTEESGVGYGVVLRTTLVIAHRLSTVRNAQRIVVLTDNGIAEQGTHEALIALGGSYANLYNVQLEI